jgi:hypothetical protein
MPMSRGLDFPVEAAPDGAQEREDRLGVRLRQAQLRGFGGALGCPRAASRGPYAKVSEPDRGRQTPGYLPSTWQSDSPNGRTGGPPTMSSLTASSGADTIWTINDQGPQIEPTRRHESQILTKA